MAIIYFYDLKNYILMFISTTNFYQFWLKTTDQNKTLIKMCFILRLPLIELILSKSLKKFFFFYEPVKNMAPD